MDSDSSASSSTRQPSPSPSPRSMRRGGRSTQPAAPQPRATSSQESHSFFHPSHNDTANAMDRSTDMYGRDGREGSLSLPIPHSNDDLDRIRLEHQLGSLSMMSSSHASSSAQAQSVDDDDGSSVELGRGYDGRNLSGGGRDTSTVMGGGSFSTVGGASPISTAGHHASVVTLRAGLVGGGGRGARSTNGAGEAFDEDRELVRMLAGAAGGGISFGLGDMGLGGDTSGAPSKQHASSHRRVTESDFRGSSKHRASPARNNNVNNENLPPHLHRNSISRLPSPLRPKLANGLTESFSPKRPASIASPPPSNRPNSRGAAQRTSSGHQESRFETLARGLEDQLRAGGGGGNGGSRMAMGEVSINGGGGRHASGSGRKKGGRGGNASMMSSGAGQSSGPQRDSQGKMRLFLPDMTGMTDVVDTPARKGRREMGEGDEEDPAAHPLPSLAALSTRLTSLETQNSLSRKRIVELEFELQTAGEREQAAKEEWKLEREHLKAEQRERDRLLGEHQRGRVQEGEWEKRYWEVVEEKKALELLVQTLRSQLARLTHDLTSQRNLITQLQNQRSLDAAEINRRGEEVERLRQEVSKLAEEVGGLRRAVEGRDSGRREAQTSPLLAQQDMERERERAMAGLGFDLGRVEEQQEEQTQRVQTRERVVSGESAARSQRDRERTQSGPKSPIERPSSRLSDGLRAAAGSSAQPTYRSNPLLPPRPLSAPRPGPSILRPTPAATGPALERTQLDQLFAASAPLAAAPSHAPQRPTAWAQEDTILDVDDDDEEDRTARPQQQQQQEASLIDFDDHPPASTRARTATGGSTETVQARSTSTRKAASRGVAEEKTERLPPQTVLARVLRELEDDYGHYKAIYIELASQYTLMDSSSNVAKRNVLAEHLKEVIDTLEQKGDQIASLYSLLAFEDRPLGGAGERERERKAFRSVKDLLRSVGKEQERQEKPRRREGVV